MTPSSSKLKQNPNQQQRTTLDDILITKVAMDVFDFLDNEFVQQH